MPQESPKSNCPALWQQYRELQELKAEFDRELERAAMTKKFEQALALKNQLEQKQDELMDGISEIIDDSFAFDYLKKRYEAGRELTSANIKFLYKGIIRGVKYPYSEGYEKGIDVQFINEIRSQRDPQKDAPVVFGCQQEQIARNLEEINQDTKAYIGELGPGIFDRLSKGIEHIYTSFPESRIKQKQITIGGKTTKELETELEEKRCRITDWAKQMMEHKDFKPAKKKEKLDLVVLSVKDLGFPKSAAGQAIYKQAQKLGLEIVPAEVGPQLRLQYKDQPMSEWLLIGSEPLAASSRHVDVFDVGHDYRGRWLDHNGASPDYHWRSDYRWVFARK